MTDSTPGGRIGDGIKDMLTHPWPYAVALVVLAVVVLVVG